MVSMFSSFFSDHSAGTDKKEKEQMCIAIALSSLPPRPTFLHGHVMEIIWLMVVPSGGLTAVV